MDAKICKKCNYEQPLSEFHVSHTTRDRLNPYCRCCISELGHIRYDKKREYYIEKACKWSRDNPEKCCAKERKYRLANPEKFTKKRREYAKRHPEVVAEGKRRYKARKRKAKGTDYTTWQHIEWRKQMWGGNCYVCGAEATTIDHVKALVKGGSHFPANLRPMCGRCNSSKQDRPLFYWAQRRAA